jgi:hypothetical protein
MKATILAFLFAALLGCGGMTVGDPDKDAGEDVDPGACTSDEECAQTYAGQNGSSPFPFCVNGSCQDSR